jgi:DNA-binding GntR family transcriptional regulator
MPSLSTTEALAQSPYDYVREGIVQGRFRSGQWLRAQELAAALGVSRTPVREALGRLHQDGLVDQDEAGGFSVHVMTTTDIADVFGVRGVLEQEAARLAMQRADPAWLDELAGILDASAQQLHAGEPIASISTARLFHLAIARRAGNALLLKLLEGISDRIQMVGLALVDRLPARSVEVLQENRSILAALRANDAAALQQAVQEHIGRSRELIFKET